MSNDPYLPYAGTSGHSGSDASADRAWSADTDGTTSRRQTQALVVLDHAGVDGATWDELGAYLGWHHGQASGVLSVLHKVGKVARLTDRRHRCHIYVLPEHVNGRDTQPHGRRKGTTS